MLIKESVLSNALALVSLYQLHEEILSLSSYFDDEIDKFEGQIEKSKAIDLSKVHIIPQYSYDIPCNNVVSYDLYELMEGFDKLISMLKLLRLSGFLESRITFYQLKERYQKKLNLLLSQVIQFPSAKHHKTAISELVENLELFHSSKINLSVLINALDAPFAPSFSPKVLENMKYKLKSHLIKSNLASREAIS